MHMTSDRRPWTSDLGPPTADLGPLSQSFSFSFSVSHPFSLSLSQSLIRESPSFSFSLSQSLSLPGPQPLSLSAPERIHEIDVASCWKPTKLIRCEHYALQHRGPPRTPHIHSQGAAEEYHRREACQTIFVLCKQCLVTHVCPCVSVSVSARVYAPTVFTHLCMHLVSEQSNCTTKCS